LSSVLHLCGLQLESEKLDFGIQHGIEKVNENQAIPGIEMSIPRIALESSPTMEYDGLCPIPASVVCVFGLFEIPLYGWSWC
jgi:hypothetical protein